MDSNVIEGHAAIIALEPKHKKYCLTRYNGNGKDIAQASIKTLLSKMAQQHGSKGFYEYRSIGETDRMLKLIARSEAKTLINYCAVERANTPEEAEKIEQQRFYCIGGSSEPTGKWQECSLDEMMAEQGFEPAAWADEIVEDEAQQEAREILRRANSQLRIALQFMAENWTRKGRRGLKKKAAAAAGMSQQRLSQALRIIREEYMHLCNRG